MKRRRASLAAVALLAAAAVAYAQEAGGPAAGPAAGGLDVGGTLLSDVSVLQTAFENPTGATPGGYSQLTLNFVNRNRQFAKVEGTGILTAWYGAYAGPAGAAAAGMFASSVGAGGAVLTLEMRKLYLAVYTPLLDISMGRQIVTFGVGTLFSPIDAFTVPLLSDLNYVRTGSDVVRVDVPFSDVSGLEAVTTVPGSFDHLSSALKVYTNVHDFDLAAVGLYRGSTNEILAGAYFKGDLELGVYGEAVGHLMASTGQAFLEGMLGADYSIEKTWFFTLEYYYNGNPASPGSLSPTALADAPALFLNQNYLYFMARWQFTDLMGISASVIYDIPAAVVLPTLQYSFNIVQNANLLVYGRAFSGDIRSGGAWSGPDFQYGVQVQVSY